MSYKYTITLLLILLTLTSLYATDISGEVQGIWSPNYNPYSIIGDIEITAGQSLSIEAGVHVIFTSLYRLTVYGSIEAIGTVADSIHFTGDSWDSIRLEDTTETSIFTHCVITGADIGINALYSSFELSHSRIGNSTDKAISILGEGESPTYITHSKIHDTVTAGINLTNIYNVHIINNEITRCGSGPQYQGAIHYSIQSALTPPEGQYFPLIKSNHIHHNYKQGITTWDITNSDRIWLRIEKNVVENNLTGIYLRYSSGSLYDNLIRNNFIVGDTNSGAGIMLAGTGHMSITNNIITGNFTGLFLTENATPYHLAGNNIIYDNIDGSGANWSIYLYGVPNDINASGNYFHSSDPATIATTIYDRNDNSALGEVTFLPVVAGGLMTGHIDLQNVSFEPILYQFTFTDVSQVNQPLVITTHRNNPDYQIVVPAGVYNVNMSVNAYIGYTSETLAVTIQENTITAGVDFTVAGVGNTVNDTVPRPSLSVNHYPNPLSAGQSVRFDVNSDTRLEMTLELFNIKGQKIATVFTGNTDRQTLPYTFDKNMPSGVYFYRLKTKDNAITRKMVVLH